MSISYLNSARAALETALLGIDTLPEAMRREILAETVLRPPRERSWGDLSTNILILLKSKKDVDFDKASSALVSEFRGLEGAAEVRHEGNDYINIRYRPEFWLDQLPLIIAEGAGYGLGGMRVEAAAVPVPAAVNDLLSCRQQVNAEVLDRLSLLVGIDMERENLPPRAAAGFPLAAAIGKCTEAKTRFALIANPPGFIDAFSPILAIDKAYNNPVFAIPYTRMMLNRFGTIWEQAKTEAKSGVDMAALKLPEEVTLAHGLCGWPLAAERALKTADGFHLAAHLQELSLLFFRLFDIVHPVSSAYLTAPETRPARRQLLGALDAVINDGVRVLGVDMVKEYA
ncbi:MAG: hypothetical protein CMN56_09255 [Sneathiella sp.]|uniref:DALR anticodon-binding domain-containing protein n=1 Tax=Sneathiella sp. TaxID=1964365 RepID=UPI000C38CA84|nr:DALR anticodon-binding domain-containing protein [Sneathiella sp.]MAZ03312.1 hypothetical protein [Sneathiella sp.]